MKKIDKFKHLMPNEVGLTIKLTDDGQLNSNIGFCFSEDLDLDRQNSMITIMHGIVSMIEESPQLLWAMGEIFRRAVEQEMVDKQEIVFEPDNELLKKLNGQKGKKSNIIDFSSRKRQ